MTPRNLATCLAPTLLYPSAKFGGMDAAMHHIGHALNLIDVSLDSDPYLDAGRGWWACPDAPHVFFRFTCRR
jgi:hypothetical protein